MSPAGIEPATFRFLAQHLNHCATTVLQAYFKNVILLICNYLYYTDRDEQEGEQSHVVC